MKKIFLVITCIALVMSVYNIETAKGVFGFFNDNVITKISSELAEIGDSENVNDFRQYPLLSIEANVFGTFTNRYNETIPINTFVMNNVLPSYLVQPNNYNYTVNITMSPKIYHVIADADVPILLDPTLPPELLSKCLRMRIVLKYKGNTHNYNFFISISETSLGYKPTYFVVKEGSDIGYIASGYATFENFLSNLESKDFSNPFLIKQERRYVLQSSTETIEHINLLLPKLYDQLYIK